LPGRLTAPPLRRCDDGHPRDALRIVAIHRRPAFIGGANWRTSVHPVRFVLFAALLGAAGHAYGICQPVAHYLYVGSGAQCSAGDIQTAINNAVCPGTNIVLTNLGQSQLWLSQVHVTVNKQVNIVGSTAGCGAPPPVCDPSSGCASAPSRTPVSGTDGAAVFYVTAAGSVAFKNLSISNGYGFGAPLEGGGGIRIFGSGTHVSLDNVELYGNRGSTEGGGLAFFGDGSLTLNGVSIHDNHALSYGGGVSAISSANGHIDVTIADNPGIATDIYGNYTLREGGGIYLNGDTHFVAATANARIHDNQVSEYGGGILIGPDVVADIGLKGNAIDHNVAGSGGGIAVYAGAIARLFNVDAMQPFTVHNNVASTTVDNLPEYSGGGLYLRAPLFGDTSHHAIGCLFDVDMIGNSAVDHGTAVAVESYAHLRVNAVGDSECDYVTVAALGAVPSASGGSRFIFNDGLNSSSQSAVIDAAGVNSQMQARRLRLELNNGYAIRAQNAAGGSFAFSECLIDNNVTSNELINVQGAPASIDGCTFADNSIGGAYAFALDSGSNVSRSIVAEGAGVSIWNPSAVSGLTAQYLLLSGPRLSTDSTVMYASPAFVDPDNGDFHLHTVSPGVDYAPAGNEFGTADLDGHPREADLPNVTNRFGLRDLGAYEAVLSDEIFKNGFQ
jgi:hypothetical protein